MQEVEIKDLSELKGFAKELLSKLKAEVNKNGATVILLRGPLGAGKTTLVQMLAEELGVSEVVTSPTFTIRQSYKTTDSRFHELLHIDAYRVSNEEEMEVLGFTKVLDQDNTLICIEWPEQIPSFLPEDGIVIDIEIKGENRELKVS